MRQFNRRSVSYTTDLTSSPRTNDTSSRGQYLLSSYPTEFHECVLPRSNIAIIEQSHSVDSEAEPQNHTLEIQSFYNPIGSIGTAVPETRPWSYDLESQILGDLPSNTWGAPREFNHTSSLEPFGSHHRSSFMDLPHVEDRNSQTPGQTIPHRTFGQLKLDEEVAGVESDSPKERRREQNRNAYVKLTKFPDIFCSYFIEIV